jgi:hypothetical protein
VTEPTDPTPPDDPASGSSEPPAHIESTTPASPSIPLPEDDRVAVLAAYLRTNRGRFTEEALARAAREAGYSDAEIKAAGTLAEPGWHGAGIPTSGDRRTSYPVVAAVAIGYVIGLYFVISGAASISSDLSGSVGLVGLLGGIVAWAMLRNSRPSLAQGIGCGVVLAIVIPIVAIVVIIGICVVTGTYPSGG